MWLLIVRQSKGSLPACLTLYRTIDYTEKLLFWQCRSNVKKRCSCCWQCHCEWGVQRIVCVWGWVQPAGCIRSSIMSREGCLRRNAYRDASERWFVAPSAGLLSESASAGRSGVRNSKVPVEYVTLPEPTASSSRSVKGPVTGSRKKISAMSGQMSRKYFEAVSLVTSPRKSYMENPSFGAALDREGSFVWS